MMRIEIPGFGSTVQDRGRPQHVRAGVPVSGPADPFAFRAAQALVGNAVAEAAIEAVGLPFSFRCESSRIVAVTGRDIAVTSRDPVPPWTSIFVRAGDLVTVTGTARSRYTYIAVSGGLTSDVLLGSRSVYPRAGLGRALRAGDTIPLGRPRRAAEDAGRRIRFEYGEEVAAMPGPHLTRFDADTHARFFGGAFTASAQSDRQGARLDGVDVAPLPGEILSCGVVAGAVQVPRGGQPIVLLADHQTTGGYPVIATVIAADLGLVAQRAPGETVRFYALDRERALLRGRERVALLASA
jgi:antagonist of KipI